MKTSSAYEAMLARPDLPGHVTRLTKTHSPRIPCEDPAACRSRDHAVHTITCSCGGLHQTRSSRDECRWLHNGHIVTAMASDGNGQLELFPTPSTTEPRKQQ